MTQETAALKPCPFCGGEAQTDFIAGFSYVIECYRCNAQGSTRDSEEAAIAAWNRRPSPSEGTVEGLLDAAEDAAFRLADLLEDTQHKDHYCGEGPCPVKSARESLERLRAAILDYAKKLNGEQSND